MKRSKISIVLAIVLMLCMLIPAASAATIDMAQSGGSLHLRKGPGRNYKSVDIVKDGDHVTVLSYGDIWTKVETDDGDVGYIKNLYINDGDNQYASGTSYFDSYTVYTTANVNMRSGASTGTVVIDTLAKGTKLKARGKNNGFYLVETEDGTQGFVSGNYISRKSSGSSSTSTSGKTKTVTASYVNMRAGGGMSYDVLRVLPRGTKVSVLKVGNYWTRVSYKGAIGWINNAYLK